MIIVSFDRSSLPLALEIKCYFPQKCLMLHFCCFLQELFRFWYISFLFVWSFKLTEFWYLIPLSFFFRSFCKSWPFIFFANLGEDDNLNKNKINDKPNKLLVTAIISLRRWIWWKSKYKSYFIRILVILLFWFWS